MTQLALDAAGARRRPRWLGIAALWAACGAFLTHQSIVFNRLRNPDTPISLPEVAFRDFLVVGTWLLLTPVVVALARRRPVDGGASSLALHLLAAAVLGAVHVTAVHLAIGNPLGTVVSSGNASLFAWNVFVYVVIAGWAHARDYADRAAEREVTQARLAATAEEARWRAASARTHPEFLTTVLARLERMVFEDVPRSERLMEQLGDLLRGSVDAAGYYAVTLRRELDLLEAAVAIARECSGATVAVRVGASNEAYRAALPPRLVRGLLDDLVVAAASRRDEFEVAIEADVTGDLLRLRVSASAPLSDEGLTSVARAGPFDDPTRWGVAVLRRSDHEIALSVRGAGLQIAHGG